MSAAMASLVCTTGSLAASRSSSLAGTRLPRARGEADSFMHEGPNGGALCSLQLYALNLMGQRALQGWSRLKMAI